MRVIFNTENRVAKRKILLGKSFRHRTSNHQPDDFFFVHFGQKSVSHRTTIAENRIMIGDFINFIELVADKQDRFALRLQALDDPKKIVDLFA